MKVFRRSKNDKYDNKPRSISIPAKDAIAIVPPKKVIKALYEYKVQNPEQNPAYLSFEKGDFLHVVGREDDPDWYEACNPLHGTRGLVPVNHFEEVGKTVRNSDQNGLMSAGATAHDSGYSEGAERSSNDAAPSAAEAIPRLSSTLGRGNGAMVYGIVQYDFKAERPDELDARAGEAIIVIAQSNPEWFVAKPITRLGGPGLIPVSFIEIRDMVTGKAVEDIHAAVQRAGVPKVEEWKKMAADYKNSSIPLGRLDSNASQSSQRASEATRTNDMNGHGDPRAPHQRNGSNYPSNNQSMHSLSQQRASQLVRPIKAKVPRFLHQNEQYWFVVESVMEDGRHWELSRQYKDFYSLQMSLRDRFPEAAGIPDQRTRILPWMPGPVPYVTDAITAGRCKHLDEYLKTLLRMDPVISGCESVRQFFASREGDYELEPDVDDAGYRLSGTSLNTPAGFAQMQQTPGGYMQPQQQQGGWASPPRSLGPSNTPSYGSLASKAQPQQLPTHYRNASDLRVPNGMPPPMLRQNSAMTQGSMASQGTGASIGGSTTTSLPPGSATIISTSASPVNGGIGGGAGPTPTTNATGALKIKVWFGEANCVVIRLPSDFTYISLVQKLRDRWALEPGVDPAANKDEMQFSIEYRDEPTGKYMALRSDEDLDEAMNRCEKLVLRVVPVAEAPTMV